MNKKPLSKRYLERWLPIIVCSMASFFYIYDFLVRVVPSAITHPLMQAFHANAAGLGLLASAFFWGYAPMQIPAGLLYDHFGPRKLLSISILSCALATIAFSLTHDLVLASFCRFVMGFTGAFAFIGPLLIASRWFPPERFSFFTGVVQFMGCVGAIVGLSPIAALSHAFGWRQANILIALGGIAASALIWLIIRDYPPDRNVFLVASEVKEVEKPTTALRRLFEVCRLRQTWWIGLYGFSVWAPIDIIATLWGTPFLMSLYNISATKASGLVSIIWVGIGLGSPLIGWWSNYIHRRCLPTWICSILAFGAGIGMIYSGPIPLVWMAVLLFVLGFSAAGQIISFGLVLDNQRDAVMGTAVGFNNMVVILGGVFLQPLVGFLLSFFWHHEMRHGIPYYSMFEYHRALIIVPIVSLVGLFTSLFLIEETRCERKFPS